MEHELRDIQSRTLKKSAVVAAIKKIEAAAEAAAEARDILSVENPYLQKALTIVEDFLREKRRICYGGMAINFLLPPKARFYDFKKVLPDYDFFSPDAESDANELRRKLEAAGLPDVAVRPGMHEGTYKVYVDYNAVADCTQIMPWLYYKLLKRSVTNNGIHYADADFLRMQMYLELSRPMGEVERWSKVYKRLLLLNRYAPFVCKKTRSKKKGAALEKVTYDIIIEYVKDNELVYAGSNLKALYESPSKKRMSQVMRRHVPAIIYSDDPLFHARRLRLILEQSGKTSYKLLEWAPQGDLIPSIVGIKTGDQLAAIFIELPGCISYNEVSDLRVASLDTLIYTYFMLSFVLDLGSLIGESFVCAAEDLLRISNETRDHGKEGAYPAFSIVCAGHQMSKASLIRAKVLRGHKKQKGSYMIDGKTKKRPFTRLRH